MSSGIERTLEYALFLARHLSHCDYSTVVNLVLCDLGIAPKNDGYICLKRAIAMYFENPARQLKGDIYVEILEELDGGVGDSDKVDQAIRRAITDAWEIRDDEVWGTILPRTRKDDIGKPTNGDFIARVAWFIELWQGCCKEALYAKK